MTQDVTRSLFLGFWEVAIRDYKAVCLPKPGRVQNVLRDENRLLALSLK